jgi:hypothetical protein
VTARSKARNEFARSRHWECGFEPTRGMEVLVDSAFGLFCVYVAALRRAIHLSKKSYQLSIRFTVSKSILIGNRQEGIIRQAEEEY